MTKINRQLIKCAFGRHKLVEVGEKGTILYSRCNYCKQPMKIHPLLWRQMVECYMIEKEENN